MANQEGEPKSNEEKDKKAPVKKEAKKGKDKEPKRTEPEKEEAKRKDFEEGEGAVQEQMPIEERFERVFSAIDELRTSLAEAGKDVRKFGVAARFAAGEAGRLRRAFIGLESQILRGTIKTFKELEAEVEVINQGLNLAVGTVKETWKELEPVLGTDQEDNERLGKIRERLSTLVQVALVPALEAHYQEMERVAVAAVKKAKEAEGKGARLPKMPKMDSLYGPGSQVDLLEGIKIPEDDKDEAKVRTCRGELFLKLNSAIGSVEVQDKAFGESWRDTWPIETMLAKLYLESEKRPWLREIQQELRKHYEDRRRVHDYFWAYQRTSGCEAILNMAAILPKSAIERMISMPGVSESMKEFQDLLDRWLAKKKAVGDKEKEERREKDKGKKEALHKEALMLEQEQSDLDWQMRRFGQGFKPELVEGKEVADERSVEHRVAARLMVVLGFTSQHMYTGFGGSGDFFVGRLLNLREHIMGQVRPGSRWQGREKIMEGYHQHLFFRPHLSDMHVKWDDEPEGWDRKTEAEKEALFSAGLELPEKYGLKKIEVPIDEDGKPVEKEEDGKDKKTVIRIVEPAKLSRLRIKHSSNEGWLGGGQVADYCFKADFARKWFRNTGKFLDKPTVENFLEADKDFEHLGGPDRWKFFEGLGKGFCRFWKYEGGIISRWFRGEKLWSDVMIKDPETRKMKKIGKSFASSDAEKLGLGQGWDSATVDGFLGRLVKESSLLDVGYAEKAKRELLGMKIGPLEISGTGPVRGFKEGWELIRKNLIWALLAMIFEAMTANIPEEFGVTPKRK